MQGRNRKLKKNEGKTQKCSNEPKKVGRKQRKKTGNEKRKERMKKKLTLIV